MADEQAAKATEKTKSKTTKTNKVDKPDKPESQPKEAPKQGARTKFVVIVAGIFLVQIVVAFLLVQKFFTGEGRTEEKKPEHAAETAETLGEKLELEDIIVNPSGGEGKRFLVVSITLVLDAKTTAQHVEEKSAELQDRILEFLSGQTVAELADVKLRKDLREKLIHLINETIAPGRVLKLYFTKFILQ